MNRLNNILFKSSKINSIFTKNIPRTFSNKYHTSSIYYSDNLFTDTYSYLYNNKSNYNKSYTYIPLINNSFNGINLKNNNEDDNKEDKEDKDNYDINFISKRENEIKYNNVKKCILYMVYYYLLYYFLGEIFCLLCLLYHISNELDKEEYNLDKQNILLIKYSN